MSNNWPENNNIQGTDPQSWEALVKPDFAEQAKKIEEAGNKFMRPTDKKLKVNEPKKARLITASRVFKLIILALAILLIMFIYGGLITINWKMG